MNSFFTWALSSGSRSSMPKFCIILPKNVFLVGTEFYVNQTHLEILSNLFSSFLFMLSSTFHIRLFSDLIGRYLFICLKAILPPCKNINLYIVTTFLQEAHYSQLIQQNEIQKHCAVHCVSAIKALRFKTLLMAMSLR